jgi:hypothetical protein
MERVRNMVLVDKYWAMKYQDHYRHGESLHELLTKEKDKEFPVKEPEP